MKPDTPKCSSSPVSLSEGCRIVNGDFVSLRDWVMDSEGYFLIRILPDEGIIEAGLCRSKNVVEYLFRGKKPEDLYYEIGKSGLKLRYDHMGYLGTEFEKAWIALKHSLEYVQDRELDFSQLEKN